ncbi:MAG: transposase [Candidatus Synoicihabitans palmerolidicus]|nr:transposase [Candidatus Synoicihabitans palmerolidicus]MCC5023975.1 transposase [Candidatus Synoicihabitans palmerolidicus]MCC5025634.1 transposase [Candidatus Synoicihabitans palmerolidicus]
MPPLKQLPAAYLALESENVALRSQLEWLRKQVFGGGKSEKLDTAQWKLKFADQQKLIEQTATPETVHYERRRASREKLPLRAEAFAHLPVKEPVVIEPEEVLAAPEQFEKIGEERSFEVDVVPTKLFKRECVRPKYRAKAQLDRAPGGGTRTGAPGGGRLRLGGTLGLGVDQQVCRSRPAVSAREDVVALGSAPAASEYGRVGAHRLRLAGTDLPGHAPQVARIQATCQSMKRRCDVTTRIKNGAKSRMDGCG